MAATYSDDNVTAAAAATAREVSNPTRAGRTHLAPRTAPSASTGRRSTASRRASMRTRPVPPSSTPATSAARPAPSGHASDPSSTRPCDDWSPTKPGPGAPTGPGTASDDCATAIVRASRAPVRVSIASGSE